MNGLASAWRERGDEVELCGRTVFTVDVAPTGPELRAPLLVLHGFPTSSFDFHRVVDRLATHRRVLLFDMLGYGLSEKPDMAYTVAAQADVAMALAARVGLDRLGLLTHDVGDTVGGELLARQLEGDWDVEITDRALTNGSIYIDLARLSQGQLLLLALPDERLSDATPLGRGAVVAGIAGTFSPVSAVDSTETTAQWQMIAHRDGERLLPRLIRYIEERRRHERRFTGAIERHPSPLVVVWGGDDPIAVPAMTDRLRRARPDIGLAVLEGVGHYPMVEAPDRFLEALGDLVD
ncbi:MAG TPA: alpha/beta hydrolase [Acidimicrobiales bacterium]|jgi:pimeloyl-ACP methyl ester carboxylesterase|nr:alpha/beta hydrolase [Acidimicrobiales bacterium]